MVNRAKTGRIWTINVVDIPFFFFFSENPVRAGRAFYLNSLTAAARGDVFCEILAAQLNFWRERSSRLFAFSHHPLAVSIILASASSHSSERLMKLVKRLAISRQA